MAVQSDTSRISYAGNNSTSTSYAVPFVFLENNHLKAIAKTSAGVETVVTLTNHTGAGDVNGGTVRTAVAVPATSTLVIYREVPATQTTIYQEGGDFPAASHERALDKLTQITQQLDRQLGQTVRMTEGMPLNPLPVPTGSDQYVLSTTSGQPPSWQPTPSLATGPITTTGSTEPRFLADRFADAINVKDFGAVGDGVTDDTAAINAAIASISSTGGVIDLPSGVYRTTSTITITSANVSISGHGSFGNFPSGGATDGTTIRTGDRTGATRIFADFTSGPVFRVRNQNCAIVGMTIDASDTRKAAALSTNYGVWWEGLDGTSETCLRSYMRNVRVTNQPSHGIVFCNNVASSTLDFASVDNCAGHGFCIVGGAFHSRSNLTRAGQVDVLNCRASRCGGHAIYVGADDTDLHNIPYRIHLHNFESFYNLITTALAIDQTYPAEIYLSGEQISVHSSASAGLREYPTVTAAHRCFFLRGANITLDSCRFVSPLNNSVTPTVGACGYVDNHPQFTSRDITIRHCKIVPVTDSAAGSIASAFAANAFVNRLEVYVSETPSQVLALTSRNTSGFVEVDNVSTLSNADRLNRVVRATIADDAVASFTFNNDPSTGMLVLAGNISGAGGALIHYRAGDASGFVNVLSSAGATVTGVAEPTRTSSSIVGNGTTATVVTSVAHGYATGNTVRITGAVNTGFNGTHTITVTDTTTFTYSSTINSTATTQGSINRIPSGTTGTDGHLTISVGAADPILYVENRTGSQRVYSLTFAAPVQAATFVRPS